MRWGGKFYHQTTFMIVNSCSFVVSGYLTCCKAVFEFLGNNFLLVTYNKHRFSVPVVPDLILKKLPDHDRICTVWPQSTFVTNQSTKLYRHLLSGVNRFTATWRVCVVLTHLYSIFFRILTHQHDRITICNTHSVQLFTNHNASQLHCSQRGEFED